MPKRQAQERFLVDDHDLTDRLVVIIGDTKVGPGVFDHDELRVTLWGHDPLPFSFRYDELRRVRASWDAGRNWWDGKMHVADWRTEGDVEHLTLTGNVDRVEEPRDG